MDIVKNYEAYFKPFNVIFNIFNIFFQKRIFLKTLDIKREIAKTCGSGGGRGKRYFTPEIKRRERNWVELVGVSTWFLLSNCLVKQ